MPGYPAFLVLMYALTEHGAEAAPLVMVAQIGVDLLSCLVIAVWRAFGLRLRDSAPDKRVYSVALWLAVLCPFTANYAAVPLTKFSPFCGRARLQFPCACTSASRKAGFSAEEFTAASSEERKYTSFAGGCVVGMGSLFRPEAPFSWSLRPSCGVLFLTSGASGAGFE